MGEIVLLSIDIPTLALSRGLMQMMLAGLLVYVGGRQVTSSSARFWAAGFLFNGFALFLFATTFTGAWDTVAAVGNHLGIALGSMCILQGFWRFNHQPTRTWVLALVLITPMLSLIAWEMVWPNARWRILMSASGQAFFLFVLQQLLRFPPRREMLHIYRRLRWVVIVYLLIFVWSYASLADVLPASGNVDRDYHRSFFSLASLLFMLTLAVSCLALRFASLAANNADLAMTDWLTGLLNRRGFFLAAERERDDELKSTSSMSIVAIDIDHFKRINDEHGHAAGDDVLKVLADTLRQLAGDNSHVARTGGEEFCILLPDARLDDARRLAESVRLHCEQSRVGTKAGKFIRFTLSAGVCQVAPSESIDQAINRADSALYVAKRDGRNRVVEHVLRNSAALQE